MPFADYQPGEIAARGEKIYQEQIKSLVYPAEKGKYLTIDVESGDYELDEDAPDFFPASAAAAAGCGELRDESRLCGFAPFRRQPHRDR